MDDVDILIEALGYLLLAFSAGVLYLSIKPLSFGGLVIGAILGVSSIAGIWVHSFWLLAAGFALAYGLKIRDYDKLGWPGPALKWRKKKEETSD